MPQECLLDMSLGKIYYTLTWLGLTLEKHESNKKNSALYIVNFIWMNADAVGCVAWFIRSMRNGESLTFLTQAAPCIALCVLSDLKSFCFVFNKSHCHELITTLRALEMAEINRANTDEKRRIVEHEMLFLNKTLKTLNFFNWMLIISFPSMALIMIVVNYLNTKELDLLLAFPIWYPFDASNMKFWPFMFVKQIWSGAIVVLGIGGADFVFFICSTSIRVQFKLLAYELERIVVDSRGVDKVFTHEEFKAKFRDIVSRHQELIHSVELLEVIYSKATLFNFVSSSVLICLPGFNVMTIQDVGSVVPFLSFLAMSILQIFFVCLFGDMIMRASVKVSDAVYNSKWYLADVKAAKILFIIQIRAQKSCRLTAMGFADVNLHAFTGVLSTAWSYFALLKTVYSPPHD